MDTGCREFENRLGDFLAEVLPPRDMRVAEKHLAECPSCRRLLEVATGEMDLLPVRSGQSLVREVLRRTSGSGCGRVREQICDFVDGALAPDDGQILAIHVQNCEACSELARILKEMSLALPGMAEVDPGASFTREVLAATVRREPAKSPRLRLLAEWWRSLVRRPRFAWEAAYTGTLLLALVMGNPAFVSTAASAPLNEVRGKTQKAWSQAAQGLTGLSTVATVRAAEAAERWTQKFPKDPLPARDSATRFWQKGHQWASNLAAFDYAHAKGWAAGVLKMLQNSWRVLGIDRTFS